MHNQLKNFLVREELSTSHAERYLTFVERYHRDVFLDLKKNVEAAWIKTVKSLAKAYPLSAEAKQDALLRHPTGNVELKLSTKNEKVISTRLRHPVEVSPSIKIPIYYSPEERDLITKQLLSVARDSIEKTIDGWSEIFNYEKKGRIEPWFKIVNDHDEVRLQLALKSSGQESYKTLYSVRVEYGKAGSKLKDYDRVFLLSLI